MTNKIEAQGRLTAREIKAAMAKLTADGYTPYVEHGRAGNCACGHGCKLDRCPVVKVYGTKQ